MFESHWGLRESPFRSLADPRYFYRSPSHEEALARLSFLVEHRRRLGLLLGGAGSGKTLLLQVLAKQLKESGWPVAMLNLMSFDSGTFLWELATQLHANPRGHETSYQLWRRIMDRVSENRYQQLTTVILLDDADEAELQVLPNVRRLVCTETASDNWLTTVVAADPRTTSRLGRRILELAELRIDLEAWEPQDTRDYLQDVLARAGSNRLLFAEEAALRLHQLAGGIPRYVSHLAELALLAGAGKRLSQVDTETVESVYEELTVGH